MRFLSLGLILAFALYSADGYSEEIVNEYTGFSLWLDCDRRGLVRFKYEITKDDGILGRNHSFKIDKDVSAASRQTSNKTYKHETEKYDRGHMVSANHLDGIDM